MSPPRKIESVQALRAVAALSIAILHVLHDAIGLDHGGLMARWHDALPWAAGVDLFFVISGTRWADSERDFESEATVTRGWASCRTLCARHTLME